MLDNFDRYKPTLDGPGRHHRAVTPSDGVDLDPIPRALRILTSGNLSIMDELGVIIVYPVTAGEEFNFRATRVMATSTTATCAAWE